MIDIYAAGLFDGEGYVRLATYKHKDETRRKQTRYQLFGGINMCDPRPLKLLHQEFGGSFYIGRAYNAKANHRTLFGWIVSSKKMYAFLKRIAPYSVVKRDEILLAIQYQEFMREAFKRQISATKMGRTAEVEEIMAYKRHIASELTRLKHIKFNPSDFKVPMNQ